LAANVNNIIKGEHMVTTKKPASIEAAVDRMIKRVNQVPVMLAAYLREIEAVDEEMRELKKAGLIYASPHWRKNKYFLLVYPQKNGTRPNPKYIGTDAKEIERALASIKRAKEYDKKAKKLNALNAKLLSIERALHGLESVLLAQPGQH
jgi:hypothetical protein